jgi:hypothetical protein
MSRSSPISPRRVGFYKASRFITALDSGLQSPETVAAATAVLRADRRPNTYVKLAFVAMNTILDRAQVEDGWEKAHVGSLLDNEEVQRGVKIAGMILGASPTAYLKHRIKGKKAAPVEGLRELLLRSEDVPVRFMNVSAEASAQLEEDFGLSREDTSQVNGLFVADTAAGEKLSVDEKMFEASASRVKEKVTGEPFTPHDRCPAIPFMKEVFWPGLVELATRVDLAFPQTLRILEADSRD